MSDKKKAAILRKAKGLALKYNAFFEKFQQRTEIKRITTEIARLCVRGKIDFGVDQKFFCRDIGINYSTVRGWIDRLKRVDTAKFEALLDSKGVKANPRNLKEAQRLVEESDGKLTIEQAYTLANSRETYEVELDSIIQLALKVNAFVEDWDLASFDCQDKVASLNKILSASLLEFPIVLAKTSKGAKNATH